MTQSFIALMLAAATSLSAHHDGSEPCAGGQKTARQAATVALGKLLFESTLLSADRRVSCATCHDAALSFTDGRRESLGILEVGVGRNAPALVAVKHVERFPGPRLTDDDPLERPAALTLAERCLAPIENPLEMGSSLKQVETRLAAIPQIKSMFEGAFGRSSHPVTPERIGEALAAHLRSLEMPDTPFGRHLAGAGDALDPIERRGLEVFRNKGKCASCHAGKALSDGRVHVAFLPGSERAAEQGRRLTRLQRQIGEQQKWLRIDYPTTGVARRLLERFRPPQRNGCEPGPQNGYGGFPQAQVPETQTLPLWDVARTAPYFRDGSEDDLATAVRRHAAELRAVYARRGRVGRLLRQQRRAAGNLPAKLKPRWARNTSSYRPPRPGELDSGDVVALVAWLKTLSPSSRQALSTRSS